MLTGNASVYKVNNKIWASEIIDTLKTPLKSHRKWLLKYIILPMARRTVAMREETKSLIILSCDLSRKALWRLGDKMHFEGLIPEPDLIFHMTVDEIDLYLKTRNQILITKAQQRKKLYYIMEK
jgi:hypothetical protein